MDLEKSGVAQKLEAKYRHNIMHQYLPFGSDIRQGYLVAYSSLELLPGTFFVSGSGYEILNVKAICLAFEQGLTEFEQKLGRKEKLEKVILQYNKSLVEFN